MDTIKILMLSTDNEELARFKSLIETEGYPFSLTEIKNTEEAGNTIKKGDYDILIANYRYDGANLQTLLPSLKDKPVLILADQEDNNVLAEILSLGINEFLIKTPDYFYINHLPIYIRKVLKNYDKEETNNIIMKAAAKRYFDLIQVIPDIVYKLDPAGRFTFVNKAIKQLGYEPEELLGKHFSEVISRDEIKEVSRAEVLKELSGKTTGTDQAPKLFDERRCGQRITTNLELHLKKKHAGEIPYEHEKIYGSIIAFGEVSATGYYKSNEAEEEGMEEEAGFFTGTVGIIRDISNRKKQEEMIRKLYYAVDQSPVPILIFDHEGIIDYVNPYFLHINGFQPDELLAKDIRKLTAKYLPSELNEKIMNAIEVHEEWEGQIAYTTPSGSRHKFYATISPTINAVGETERFIVLQTMIQDTDAEKNKAESITEEIEKHFDISDRMSNHIQLLAALCNLEAVLQNKEEKPQTFSMRARITALSLGYDELKRNKEEGIIDFGRYANAIITSLQFLRQIDSEHMQVSIETKGISLDFDTAVICGLICCEISSHFLLHSAAEKSFTITISMEKKGKNRTLSIICEPYKEKEEQFIALEITKALCEKLSGTQQYNSGPRAKYVFDFPSH